MFDNDLDLFELYQKYNKEAKDNVNHPSHYNNGDIEVIDYIEDKLGKEG